ncbi:MAG: DUF4913 domain-containing protein [Microbacteriaceae bacterium]|nr:DUF4913 domain-containing protein [Microbacteriaceae bacterium]
MSGIREWDDEPAEPAPATPAEPAGEPPAAAAPPAAAPELFFGSVDEFVREKLRYVYVRRVGPSGPHRWAADWWKYPEAISRLDALWRAWEALRLEPTFGMSVWWRDHADHHMAVLLSPEGPFADARDRSEPGEPLPYTAPPVGMFVDVRATPAN